MTTRTEAGGVTAAGRGSNRSNDTRATWVVLLVATAFFMENLDGTLMVTALPQMAASFGVKPLDMSAGITAYLLSLAVFIPVSGWVADRFGVRTVFMTALATFTAASALCGAAQGFDGFVAARVLQGMAGALMVPVGRLAVLRSTRQDNLMRAIAVITWPGLVAPILAPPLGGFIVTFASWRWLFYLNVLPGCIGVWLTYRFFDAMSAPAERRPFDVTGFVLCGLACSSLIYATEHLGSADSSSLMLTAGLVTGVVTTALAVWHLRGARAPLVSLATLRIKTFGVAVGGGSIYRISIGAVPFLLSLMFQTSFGLSAFVSGLLTLSVFAGNLAMKPLTSAIIRRCGFRAVLLVNGVLASLTVAAMSLLSPTRPIAWMVAILFASGLARSLQFTALNTLSFADVPKPQMSAASTLSSVATQLTMAFGVSAGAIALRASQWLLGVKTIAATTPPPVFQLAFIFVAVLGACGLIDLMTLPRDAGASISGR
jgi:EmrB/QacA subfamily drug resistance transporter